MSMDFFLSYRLLLLKYNFFRAQLLIKVSQLARMVSVTVFVSTLQTLQQLFNQQLVQNVRPHASRRYLIRTKGMKRWWQEYVSCCELLLGASHLAGGLQGQQDPCNQQILVPVFSITDLIFRLIGVTSSNLYNHQSTHL